MTKFRSDNLFMILVVYLLTKVVGARAPYAPKGSYTKS